MNPDDKLKEAALEYMKDAYHEASPFTSALQSFLAGAAYRDPEINALLEIVKMQREALDQLDEIGFHLGYNSVAEITRKAITATDEKLKSMGVEI